MYFTRALIVALISYSAMLGVAMLAGKVLQHDVLSGERPPEMFYLVTLIISVIVSYLAALQYFKKKEIAPSPGAGAYLGLVMVCIGAVLDTALLYPQLSAGNREVLSHMLHPLLLASIVAVVATTAFVGYTIAQEKNERT